MKIIQIHKTRAGSNISYDFLLDNRIFGSGQHFSRLFEYDKNTYEYNVIKENKIRIIICALEKSL